MRFLYCLLPLLGSAALAQELATTETCQCPQANCPGNNTADLCLCLNDRETACAEECDGYKPTYRPCPISLPSATKSSSSTPSLKPTPSLWPTHFLRPIPSLKPTPKPVICECPKVNCLAIWPGGCYCANNATQNCYDKCGGEPPKLESCDVAPIPIIEPIPLPVPDGTCECESVICVQSWPESCYCANAAAEACNKKCGLEATLKSCPPQNPPTMITRTKSKTRSRTKSRTHRPSSSTPSPSPTSTPTPLPPNPHQLCGGGRPGYLLCDEGYTCITDPYTPGCGPACDGLGICVEDKMCGGFADVPCDDKTMECHDDPRDDCDPMQGGADCGGLCIAPHKSLHGDM